jgi:hypothetical protein
VGAGIIHGECLFGEFAYREKACIGFAIEKPLNAKGDVTGQQISHDVSEDSELLVVFFILFCHPIHVCHPLQEHAPDFA